MSITKKLFFFLLQFFLVDMLKHEKPVAQLLWRGRCTREARALNDCNWCRCDRTHRYTCDARACHEVDMFGHFNDAIRDMDVGMEGHGAWRSTESACEPGVQYRRGGLLCVCTDDGTWPNPVCRDVFRVLHSVEQTGDSKVNSQKCVPTKLYLIGCNVCFCPSTGKLNPELCTRQTCTENDPVLKDAKQGDANEQSDDQATEIYAECKPDHKYKMGCKTCHCLRNNRLHCGNCTNEGKDGPESYCKHVKPGQTFSRDCNLCYCDKKNFAYCTTKKCLPATDAASFPRKLSSVTSAESMDLIDEENCIPGRNYKNDCNDCFCFVQGGQKTFGCTLKSCRRTDRRASIQKDCVKGSVYEMNCLICHCDEINGVKAELCHVNPECKGREAVREQRSNDLDSLHGYCEPLHVYKKNCNTCHCLSDGKTVRCTSYVCEKVAPDPVTVDIVPVTQNNSPCPKGLSYKIDCNLCFCLANGNAICTTADCKRKMRT